MTDYIIYYFEVASDRERGIVDVIHVIFSTLRVVGI